MVNVFLAPFKRGLLCKVMKNITIKLIVKIYILFICLYRIYGRFGDFYTCESQQLYSTTSPSLGHLLVFLGVLELALRQHKFCLVGKAPIKVLARKKFKSSATGLSSDMSSHLVARDICLRHFNEAFGQTILHSVEFRADPVLFKEQDLIDDMNLYYLDGAL